MITGFRWCVGGAQEFFGVEPDLSTFGKAMANGFSLAAVAGKRKIMELGSIKSGGAERVFLLSSTHGSEMGPLAAFQQTMDIYEKENVCRHFWDYGQRLKNAANDIAKQLGIVDYFSFVGPAISLNYVTKDLSGNISMALRTLFAQEMLANGVMMPWVAVSKAHSDQELEFTKRALKKTLQKYSEHLDDPERMILGEPIKPVFRQFN